VVKEPSKNAPASEGEHVKMSDRAEDDIIFADGAFIQMPRASVKN
jgi:hypothetical protein